MLSRRIIASYPSAWDSPSGFRSARGPSNSRVSNRRVSSDDYVRTRWLNCPEHRFSMKQARTRQSPAPSFYLYHSDIEHAEHARIRSMRIFISRINLVLKAWGCCCYDFALTSSTSRRRRIMLGSEKLRDNSQTLPTNQPTYPPHPVPRTRERARESRSKRICHPQTSARGALFPVHGSQLAVRNQLAHAHAGPRG
jgi:hypothetical protein